MQNTPQVHPCRLDGSIPAADGSASSCHLLNALINKGSGNFDMAHKEYIVPLSITADAYQRLYSGDARNVLAHDQEGRKIQFPASSLRPFVTHEGIRGTFIVRVDEHNKLTGIHRVED